MKKIVMMAMMLVASATAFAANSEALKAILKTKTYDEAESLVKSTLSQLANDQEKAKAYNQVVKLALEAFNQTEKPLDEATKASVAYIALANAIECDKYDQLPDEKNRVKPAFREKNQAVITPLRIAILQAAQNCYNSEDYQKAFQYASLYVTSVDETLITTDAKTDRNTYMSYMGPAAYWATASAFNLKDMATVGKFARVAMKEGDAQIADYAFRMLVESVKGGDMETAADSTRYESNMKALMKEFPDKEQLFASLTEFYINSMQYDKALTMCDERLAAYPDSVLPHAYKGSIYMGQEKYDEAIASFKQVPATDRNYLLAQFNIGACYNQKAVQLNEQLADKKSGGLSDANAEKVKDVLREALGYMEKARELDPNHEKVRWAYPLYRIYYSLGNKEKMAELEAIDPSLKQE